MPVTVPPKGTRGFPFPRIISRVFSPLVPGMFRRRPQKTSGGIQTLLIETRGAKSAKPRYAILGFIEDGPSAWLVVASAVGLFHHPHWIYNLAKNPHATVEFYGGRRVDVEADFARRRRARRGLEAPRDRGPRVPLIPREDRSADPGHPPRGAVVSDADVTASGMDAASAVGLLDLAEELSPLMTGPAAGESVERLDTRSGDIEEAVAWFVDAGRPDEALRLAIAAYRLRILKRRFEEGDRAFAHVLDSGAGDDRLRARAFLNAGFMPFWMGDDDAGRVELFGQALEMAVGSATLPLISQALGGLARVALRTDVPEGRRLAARGARRERGGRGRGRTLERAPPARGRRPDRRRPDRGARTG